MSSLLPLRASPPLNGNETDSEPLVNEGKPDSKPWVVHEYVKTVDLKPGTEGELCTSKGKAFDPDTELFRQIFHDEPPLKEKNVWVKYFQQIRDSEGFDITDFPGCGPMTTIAPMAPSKQIAEFAAQALAHYNEKNGTKCEFKEIIKVNGYCTAYFDYYITFTVTNTNGEEEYFQAHVEEDVQRHLEFLIIRPRAKGASGI